VVKKVMMRRKLRIALVTDAYYPHVGGIQEHVYHLGVELKKRGHLVKVITGAAGESSCPPGLDVIRVGRIIQYPANKSFSKMTVGLGIGGKLLRVFRNEKFDIVHVHGALSPFLPIYSHILSHTTTIHRYLSGKYTIIPNGIDTQRFNPRNERCERFKGKEPMILFVGRFEPRKGLKFLFLAFNEIIAQIPGATLVIVGEGKLRDYYKGFLSTQALQSVYFEGKVSMEVLPSYFATSDIFCSPAYTGESFGIILLEALASGTPVVASDIQGYRTVIRNGHNGLLVPPKNPGEITGAIIRILENAQLRKQLVREGLKSAQKYSWNTVTDTIEKFYFETLQKKQLDNELIQKNSHSCIP
jgi:phosphatidylinositol alpha-mannosyltransferase